MKKSIIYLTLVFAGLGSFFSCEKQNEPEALEIQVVPELPDTYYEALREY